MIRRHILPSTFTYATVSATLAIPGYILAELHFHPERITALAADIAGAHPASVMQAFLRRLRAQLDERIAIGTMRTPRVRCPPASKRRVTPMPRPLAMRPDVKSQRPELAWAAQSM